MAGWVCPGKLWYYCSSQQLLLTQPIITGINNCACTLETAPSPTAEHLVNQKLCLRLTSPNFPSSPKPLSVVAVLALWALEIWIPLEHSKVSSWTGSLSHELSAGILIRKEHLAKQFPAFSFPPVNYFTVIGVLRGAMPAGLPWLTSWFVISWGDLLVLDSIFTS